MYHGFCRLNLILVFYFQITDCKLNFGFVKIFWHFQMSITISRVGGKLSCDLLGGKVCFGRMFFMCYRMTEPVLGVSTPIKTDLNVFHCCRPICRCCCIITIIPTSFYSSDFVIRDQISATQHDTRPQDQTNLNPFLNSKQGPRNPRGRCMLHPPPLQGGRLGLPHSLMQGDINVANY